MMPAAVVAGKLENDQDVAMPAPGLLIPADAHGNFYVARDGTIYDPRTFLAENDDDKANERGLGRFLGRKQPNTERKDRDSETPNPEGGQKDGEKGKGSLLDILRGRREAGKGEGKDDEVKGKERADEEKKDDKDKKRSLTHGETAIASRVFGTAISDLDKVEIRNYNYMPGQLPSISMTPNGNIHMAKDLRQITDFSTQSIFLQAHLIHELTHVWQRQQGMNVVARGLVSGVISYDYELEPGKKFKNYRMEQQATIVADYFLSLNGIRARKAQRGEKMFIILSPAAYEAVIPWIGKSVSAPPSPVPSKGGSLSP